MKRAIPTSAAPAGHAAVVLAAASRVLQQVAFESRSLERGFAQADPGAPRAAVRAVALGSLRWYWQLAPLIDRLLEGRAIAPALRALLIASLHQLERSRNPVEATVSSAVDAARLLGQPRAAGMVNALLRRYLRERRALLAVILEDPAAASAHPAWLLEALRESYPSRWREIVEADNAHPPMTLRVNLARTTREQYLAQLQQAAIAARALPWLPAAIVLEEPRAVGDLPGFDRGLVSVQDAGAQWAAVLLAALPGERVLDACAAPGGKTGALLEATSGQIELTAIDLDAERLRLVGENLERLGLAAKLVTADLREDPAAWWDGRRYDRILLDAPCSSTGVLRRHPDIRVLRRASDIPAFAATQRQLLERCLVLLRPGGRLLYATCSLLPAENEAIVEAVVRSGKAHVLPVTPPALEGTAPLTLSYGVQLLPSYTAPSDGFYYASLSVT